LNLGYHRSGTAGTFTGRSLLGRIAFYGLAPVLW
jgi:hypothetical protein